MECGRQLFLRSRGGNHCVESATFLRSETVWPGHEHRRSEELDTGGQGPPRGTRKRRGCGERSGDCIRGDESRCVQDRGQRRKLASGSTESVRASRCRQSGHKRYGLCVDGWTLSKCWPSE